MHGPGGRIGLKRGVNMRPGGGWRGGFLAISRPAGAVGLRAQAVNQLERAGEHVRRRSVPRDDGVVAGGCPGAL